MQHSITIYLLIMAAVTLSIRILPLTLIRKQIHNPFLKSFLFYVPYITLAVMTFPAILEATNKPIAGAFALIIGSIAAWKGSKLFTVSVVCCLVVFVVELLPFC